MYIGYKHSMTIWDRNLKQNIILNIRVLDLRVLLLQKVISLFAYGAFRTHLPPMFTLKLSDWIDGSSVLGCSLLACLVNIQWDPTLFVTSCKISVVQRPMPFALTFNKETIANINALRTLLGHLNQHLLAPVEYKNHRINFQLRTSKADNSGMEKAWGNSVGGHYKCTECGINFATDSVISFSSSLQVARLTPKSLQSIMEHCKAKTGTSIGISFLPGILLDDASTPLANRGLDEYRKGHDHLHNTKGHMANLFSQFESEPGFQKKLAQQNLLLSDRFTWDHFGWLCLVVGFFCCWLVLVVVVFLVVMVVAKRTGF